MKCMNPACHAEILAEWKSCPECGTPVLERKSCDSCGCELQAHWKLCPACGAGATAPKGLLNQDGLMRAGGDIIGGNRIETHHQHAEGATVGGSIYVNVAPPTVSSVTVHGELCPICSKVVQGADWFMCRECGRSYIHVEHQDEGSYLCKQCVARKTSKQAEEDSEVSSLTRESQQNVWDPRDRAQADKGTEDDPEDNEDEVRRLVLFDIEECRRCLRFGNNTREYLEKVQETRLPQWSWAAMRGWPEGQYLVGDCYLEGVGVTQDYGKAISHWLVAAEQGFAMAQRALGTLYFVGIGLQQDKSSAAMWYRKAAEQGDALAQVELGRCYDRGWGVAEDKEEAIQWYRKAAEQDEPKALCEVGEYYLRDGSTDKNPEEALRWLRKAADLGDSMGQWWLGTMYARGEGVSVDKQEAVKWYRKAADQGLAGAQNALAMCLDNGEGVPQNKASAAMWYRKAAEQGHAVALFNLGVCFEEGDGVPKDREEAMKWYRQAAKLGVHDADERLRQLGKKFRLPFGR